MKIGLLFLAIMSTGLFASVNLSSHCVKVHINNDFYAGYRYKGQLSRLNYKAFQYFRLYGPSGCGYDTIVELEKNDYSFQYIRLHKPTVVSLRKQFCQKAETQDLQIEFNIENSSEYISTYATNEVLAINYLHIHNPTSETSFSVEYIKCSDVPKDEEIY